MLFPPSLITSSYGFALFSCPPVNKPSCQTVLFQDFPRFLGLGWANVFPGRKELYVFLFFLSSRVIIGNSHILLKFLLFCSVSPTVLQTLTSSWRLCSPGPVFSRKKIFSLMWEVVFSGSLLLTSENRCMKNNVHPSFVPCAVVSD